MTEDIVASVATALAGFLLVPQIVRLLRRREVTGVAVTWAALGCIGNATWVVYLGALDLWGAAAAPALAMISYAVIVVLVLPSPSYSWTAFAGFFAALLTAIGWFGGLRHLGVALVVVPAVQIAPQVAAVYREARPTGVSPTTWILSVAEAVLWMAFGLMVGDLALIGYGLVTSVGSGLVLAGWWMALRWQPHPRRTILDVVPHELFEQARGEIIRTG